MTCRRIITSFIILAMFVAITSTQNHVEAARVLSQDFSGEKIHLATLPSIYEKAKNNLSFLLERLPSGPSPKGPGH
ncbi:hypothetical protein EJD97_013829 [Solanum chilense]|uniref:Uncharacterized protein n=2 Tax=Solanum subgen. Lycopersicon TaxID=49274 RepID=A0A3Q7G5K5_SOLLC|nr:hypothetical protein EJD97_013829 [Solanum chilense]